MNFQEAKVVDFGKVVFAPRNHTVPSLPDMNLIVFYSDNVYQAVCIDIEIDAVGNTLKEACNNLRQAIMTYTKQMIYNYSGNTKAAIEDIVKVSFCQGDLKTVLFNRYLHAKRDYILNKLASRNKVKSRLDDFTRAFSNILQIQPVKFKLSLAAGVI